ncbi:lipopolysaccharide export system protein LptA [Methylophilaceae bacterium]|nr:lipopolysaccharide export system protein LptA [Methylophilaceae bacterium]
MRLSFFTISSLKIFFTCLCIFSISSSYVFAEKADRDKPIELESDTMTSDDSKNTSVYSGNVILTQGTLLIKADELTIREDNQGFQHSTSIGNPTTFKQKQEGKNEYIEGSAQRIEYDGRMDKVHLYSKAWVKKVGILFRVITSCTTQMLNLQKQCQVTLKIKQARLYRAAERVQLFSPRKNHRNNKSL